MNIVIIEKNITSANADVIVNAANGFKYQQSNGFILGGSCSGRAIHPWDDLKSCPKCGGYPWFVGKDGKDFHSGSPYKIICSNHNCDCQSIQSDNIELCRDDWNGKDLIL